MEGHRQLIGDGLGLIDETGPFPTDVQFLQTDDIGLVLGDDGCDPRYVEPAVDANATVDIVGQQAGHEV
jgi:hypothetical protein